MNIIGIVCEYNPFHNGHMYQINEIKKKYKDSIIIVVCSSSFTQRGNLSLLNKWDKTKIALLNNVDIVLELPYVYTVQSSDIFAEFAINILNELINSAKVQLNNTNFNTLVQKYLKDGINYPTALNNALKDLKCSPINTPNDLLGVSYIKTILENNYNIKIDTIKRTNDYHDINSNDEIVSASNIRNKILNNEDYKHMVPSITYEILKNKKQNNKYFEYLKYKIISESNLDKYLDVDEGLSTRIKESINKSNTLEELIQNIKTKRYTYNKISRMLNHILCSFTKEEKNNTKDLEYLRILGFSNIGKEYLNKIKKDITTPILNKYDTSYEALKIEKRVSEIYSLIYEDIMDKEIKNKPIKKDEI